MNAFDPAFWRGRRVLLTGHTGFKGAWLAFWLRELGAQVLGYALAPNGEQEILYRALGRDLFNSVYGDVADAERLRWTCEMFEPEIVFHLAAQSIVAEGYENPTATFATNAQGTVILLDSIRKIQSVRAVVVVTSDKCYENTGEHVARKESDRLGGNDPYSMSKAATELVVHSFRASYFAPTGRVAAASVRAGNVIGGGDFSRFRLVPDLMRAMKNETALFMRMPGAVRPWQHVFDVLAGYMQLAERLLSAGQAYARAWNFGPADPQPYTAREIVEMLMQLMDRRCRLQIDAVPPISEAEFLQIDPTLAREHLNWHTRLDLSDALKLTADWYKAWLEQQDLEAYSRSQIHAYAALPHKKIQTRRSQESSDMLNPAL